MIKACITTQQFAERIQSSQARLYRIAFCYVKNEQDALDIVGEAIYKGMSNLHTLKEIAYFNTWITRIVINTAIDFTRKHKQIMVCENEILELACSDTNDFDVEDTVDLYEALDYLSSQERSCIVLRYFEDRTFTEIAEILQEPESTVKTRVYRSLKKLRGYL